MILRVDFDLQFFGGGGGSATSSAQYRKRDPEPQELADLRGGLYANILPNLQSYDPSRWNTAQGIADSALQKQIGLLDQAGAQAGKGDSIVDEMLGVIRSGDISNNLTDRMNASVTKELQSGMGSMLSNYNNRGVLNSSITGAGINNLAANAADAYNKNFQSAFNSVLGGYGSALQGAQGNAQGLLGAASGLGGVGTTAFNNAGAQLMPAYNLWKDAQSSYDSREDFDTVVTQNRGK
jgi:hypothetical protein